MQELVPRAPGISQDIGTGNRIRITPGAAPAELPEDCPAEHLFPVPDYYTGEEVPEGILVSF